MAGPSCSVDIVIRSYYRDARWLALALRSIELYASGYRNVVVVLPPASAARMDPVALWSGPRVRFHTCEEFADDYAGQQVTKLYADRYSDADVIALVDSDEVFVAPCELRGRLFDGAALRMAFRARSRRPDGDGWRRCPDAFLGQPVPFDLTVPGPLAVRADLLRSMRAFCERAHGISLADYALGLPVDRLCEMALLRGYALTHERERYAWIDGEPLVPECRVFWSRGQTPASVARELPAPLAATLSR